MDIVAELHKERDENGCGPEWAAGNDYWMRAIREIERLRAFNYRLRAGLEWIVENADPKKCPMIVGRAKAALHE